MLAVRKEEAMGSPSSPTPGYGLVASPTCKSTIQYPANQNVAGLWLKYGAKSLKIKTSWWCGILVRDATNC
jgi:hypothetical protein